MVALSVYGSWIVVVAVIEAAAVVVVAAAAVIWMMIILGITTHHRDIRHTEGEQQKRDSNFLHSFTHQRE